MTVYFTSDPPAWLRLGGEYAGVIDGFVRRAELAFEQPLPVEAYPGNNFSPLNFFMDEAFFASPPDFARVYLMGGDALVRLFGYPPKDCALRELEEECGLVTDSAEKFLEIYPTVAYSNEHIYVYLAHALKGTHAHLDEGEFLNVRRMPFKDALKMVLDMSIRDSKTVAAILKYAYLNKISI